MKILLIIGSKRWSFNRRINGGFVEKLANFKDIELSVFDRLTMLQRGETILSLYNSLRPDVIICYAKIGKLNFASFTDQIHCAKIAIEVDYNRRPLSLQKLYKICKFDLVLQRGAFPAPKNYPIPWAWLPFSADPTVFHSSGPFRRRKNIVGFAGSSSNSYPVRLRAINILKQKQLLEICRKCYGSNYQKFLRENKAYLTSTELDSPHGKMFEILASGAAVLSGPLSTQEVLGLKDCLLIYQNDCSNIVDQAKLVIHNSNVVREIANNGYNAFRKYHTDDLRLKELYEHIQNVVNGKPLIKPWGI
jgi:hypothetical protein